MGNEAVKSKKGEGKVTDSWKIGKKLGKGSFGTVRICQRQKNPTAMMPLHLKAAVKIIDKKNLGENELKNLSRESEILAKADHPNCVRLFEIFDTKNRLYLVQELCSGGELFDAITKSPEGMFSEARASNVIRQVASALQYLHEKGIAHRDLKPENILYFDKEQTVIKIMDFGLARVLDSNDVTLMTRCGTLHYVAPEVLSRQQGYNNKCDMWSLGVVTYVLLCGYLPFYQEDRATTARLIRLGRYEYDPEEWSAITENAKDLIDNLILIDVDKRFSADQVLKHPWITGHQKPAMQRIFSKSHSERFEQLNEKRKNDNLVLLSAMAKTSIQMQRWIQGAANNVGEVVTPAAKDDTPLIQVHE